MARQVLPIVGAIIGAVWGGGNWQAGYAIGAAIGNAVDPLVVNGPKLGEAATQTAQEGVPWVQLAGTNRFAGNLIFKHLFDPVKVKEKQGKGSGPVTVTERRYGTFAIGLAMNLFDGPGQRQGIKALRKIWKRETLIYDVSEGSTILRESAQLAKNMRFYRGDDTQLPDPDIEAILGIGEANALRGRSYVVFFNIDLTAGDGAVEQYHFEAFTEGDVGANGGGWIFGPVAENGAAGGPQQFYLQADTLEELPLATPRPAPAWMSNITRICRTENGAVFMSSGGAANGAVSFDGGSTWQECNSPIDQDTDVTWNGNYYYARLLRSADGITWEAIPNLPAGAQRVIARQYFNNPIVAAQTTKVHVSLDDGGNWVEYAGYTGLDWYSITPGHLQFKLSHNTFGYYTDDLFKTLKIEHGSITFYMYRSFYSDDFSGTWMCKTFPNGILWTEDGGKTWELTLSVALGSNTDNTVAYGDFTWAAARIVAGSPHQWFLNINREGGKPGGWTELATPIYGNGGHLIYAGDPRSGIAEPGTVSYGATIRAVVRRCKRPESIVEVAHLEAEVLRGLIVGSQDYTGADVIASLCRVALLDPTEFDGKIQFIRRGGEPVASLTEEDLLDDVSEDDGDFHLFNDVEQPGKIMLFYQNAGINYAPSKAEPPFVGYRDNAVNEVAIQVPVVLRDTDEAPQLVDKLDKIYRTDARGEITRVFSDRWTKLVPASVILYTERTVTRRLRVTHTTEWAGAIKCRLRMDQQSDVTSDITSIPYATPKPPPATFTGLTKYVWLNAPAIADSDDRFGFRVAGGSSQPGWHGWALQQRTTAGAEFDTLDIFNDRAVIGYLLDPLPAASAYGTDTTNVIRVGLLDARQTLEPLTLLQFLQEGGGWALVRQDGTLELGQARDVVDEGEGIFQLSYLARGRGNTGATAHEPGEMFVLLSSTDFVEMPYARLGETLEQRPVSNGMLPEQAPVVFNDFTPAQVQTEFPVAFLRATRSDSNALTIAWSERRRLGTVRNPVRSGQWLGYRVTLIKGATTVVLPDQILTGASYDATALGAGVTVRVQQINNITGLGPASEVIV